MSATQLLVAVQAPVAGSTPQQRGGGGAEGMVSELRARYYQTTRDQNSFSVANQAAVTTTAGLATTFTGLAIANPTGSGFNMVLNKFKCAQFAVGAAAAIGIMVGAGAAAGSLTPVNRQTGGRASIATGSAGATIATPVLWDIYRHVGSLATAGYSLTPR